MRKSLDLLVRAALLLVAAALVVLLVVRFLNLPGGGLAPIAHAGGRIEGRDYTNAIAALDANHERGFRLFEIDFLKTADGRIVCGHDWSALGGEALDLAGFIAARGDAPTRPCTLEELEAWFAAHPEATLVTDAKQDELEINAELAARFDDRMIAQAYDFDEVCAYREAGVERVILTLYRLSTSARGLYRGLDGRCAGHGGIEALTMDTKRVVYGHALVAKLAAGVPVYTHTVNSCASALAYWVLGADAVYTDTLATGGCSILPGG